MYAEERQQAITALVISQGRASVTELAQVYDVTTETVRRDLAVLDRAGMLRRVHGGAVPIRFSTPTGPDRRDTARAEHERAIARAATDYLARSGSTVVLDADTTVAKLAALLPTDRELRVVTNSVSIAARLAALPTVELQVLGGRVHPDSQACIGQQAVRDLAPMRVDVAFMGTAGISVAHGLSTSDPEAAAVKRAMIECASFVVILADSSKIRREEFISFTSLDRVDVLVTDWEISDADCTHFAREGLEVVVAPVNS